MTILFMPWRLIPLPIAREVDHHYTKKRWQGATSNKASGK
jgi:hypothetical protein